MATSSAFGPRERLGLDFASATLDVAQHPVAGVAKVGARLARYALSGTMTPAEVANLAPTADELKRQVSVTAASHRLAGVYGVPQDSLRKSVPFAYEGLVLGSIISAGAEFSKGVEGRVLTGVSVDGKKGPVIDLPTDEQRERFALLAGSSTRMYKFGTTLGTIAAELANPMSNTQESLQKYHAALTDVSAKYARDASDPDRMAELGAVRDQLAVDLRPRLMGALGNVGGILVENVLRSNPTAAVVGHYFAPPQA